MVSWCPSVPSAESSMASSSVPPAKSSMVPPAVSSMARLGLALPSAPGMVSGGIDQDEASLDPSSRSIPALASSAPSSSLVEASLDSIVPPSLDVSLASSPLFPEDPVALALSFPVEADIAAASRIDFFDAALELNLLPACGAVSSPVTGVDHAAMPARASETAGGLFSNLRPYQTPSHYPVRSSGRLDLGSLKTSSTSYHPDFEFSSLSFPPLPKSGGLSNSQLPPPPPSAAASPVSPPVVVPADAVAPGAAKISWASLVSDIPAVMELSYHKPTVQSIDGRVRCSIPPAVAINGAAAWENTIVGFFLDKLPFSLVNSQAHRLWDAKGLSEVLCNGNGFFFFKFHDKAMCLDILNGGPWYFGGRPIFLKAWRSGMNLSKEGCKRVPIWAHFLNVPLEFWTAEGL